MRLHCRTLRSHLLPFLPLPPLEVGPLKPARESGSVVSSPAGFGAELRAAENEFGASRAVRKSLVAIILSFKHACFILSTVKN